MTVSVSPKRTQLLAAARERILVLDATNRAAQRNRIFTVAQLGAPHRALEFPSPSGGLLAFAVVGQIRLDFWAVLGSLLSLYGREGVAMPGHYIEQVPG